VTIPNDQFDPGHDTPSNESPSTKEITADFRRDLAFPTLSEEMVQRLVGYGREEIVPQGAILYTQGDRNTDMFVVLDGGVDVLLPSLNGASKVFARHRKHDFSGEFSLLNSQRAVTEARTTVESRLLRISRSELRLLMRVEGDIANIIVSAAIWRRIGINGEASSGVVLRGWAGNAELIHLQRFLVRNYYPHRIEEIPSGEARVESNDASKLPAVVLSDGRTLVRPSIAVLADELGITELPDAHTIYDVAVVGAGPSAWRPRYTRPPKAYQPS
jgi:thioredoxin reductase (NADPH)